MTQKFRRFFFTIFSLLNMAGAEKKGGQVNSHHPPKTDFIGFEVSTL